MIQDILPLHLQNQYEKKQPDDTSYMMIYRENKILVREGETLAFLTYRELREICETAGEMAPQSIYLFSVGEETYFLTELPEHMDDTDRSFLDDLLPWSDKLPSNIRKPQK